MSKEEVQGHLNKIRRDADQIQEQQRREWFQQIVKEAKDRYGFKTLGELVAFIVNHATELQESSEAYEKIRRRGAKGSCMVQTPRGARQKRRAARTQVSETRSEEIAMKFG
jgi:ferritin